MNMDPAILPGARYAPFREESEEEYLNRRTCTDSVRRLATKWTF